MARTPLPLMPKVTTGNSQPWGFPILVLLLACIVDVVIFLCANATVVAGVVEAAIAAAEAGGVGRRRELWHGIVLRRGEWGSGEARHVGRVRGERRMRVLKL